MLTVMPMKNEQNKIEILSKNPNADEVLSANNGNDFLGYIAFSSKDKEIIIYDISVVGCENLADAMGESYSLADSLIRSAMSYGLNRNCFILKSVVKYPQSLFNALGFVLVEGVLVTEAMQILNKTCKNC